MLEVFLLYSALTALTILSGQHISDSMLAKSTTALTKVQHADAHEDRPGSLYEALHKTIKN